MSLEKSKRTRARHCAVAAGSDLADLAAKVSNDISEEIDCGETREELRACIKWWADYAMGARMLYVSARDELMVEKMKRLHGIVLPQNVKDQTRGQT